MGISELNAQTTMKFALVVCFAALVACEPEAKPEAEADPWLAYGYGAYPYAYGGYRAYGYGYPYAHHGLYYGKRSAEAEPKAEAEADPWYTYGAYGLGYAGYHGLGYRTYGYPYAHHGYAYYGKRSADAEPAAEPKADADAYYGYYGYGARPYYGYGLGYRGYGLGYRGYYWG